MKSKFKDCGVENDSDEDEERDEGQKGKDQIRERLGPLICFGEVEAHPRHVGEMRFAFRLML